MLAAREGLPLVPAPRRPAPAPRAARPQARISGPVAVASNAVVTAVEPPGRAQLVVADVVSAGGCAENLAENLEGDAVGLSATYWLDCDETSIALLHSVTIRFVGRRIGAEGRDPRDRFERIEQVDGLLPGSGWASITTKVVDVNPGQWEVTAAPVAGVAARPGGAAGRSSLPVRRVTTRTRLAPLLHGPGVRQLAWPALVLLGVLVALVTQALLVQRSGGDGGSGLAVSVAAVGVGYLCAKAWYLVLHRQGLRNFIPAGTCIQGFLLGGFGSLAVGSILTGTPVGLLVDATTPGVFLAMFIGRPGCFLGGCCVGRPTSSRWGLWSSDRRIGVRRIPVQLLEAAMALAIGIVTLALYLAGPPPLPGALFVGAVATYTVGRQLMFPLRREPRRTSAGRILTLAAAGLVVVGAVLASMLLA